MINLSRKVKYKIVISLILILGTIGITFLFSIHSSEITKSLTQIEGMWDITIFILIRISITITMAYFSFLRWFKKEKLKFMDINFLFGLFFLGLAFGKSLDLLYKLIYFTSNEENKLIVLKIRYVLIILTSAPLILIGIDLILNSILNCYKKLTNDLYRTIFSLIVIITLIIIQVAFVIVAFYTFNLQIILFCIHLPSLAWIIYTFFSNIIS